MFRTTQDNLSKFKPGDLIEVSSKSEVVMGNLIPSVNAYEALLNDKFVGLYMGKSPIMQFDSEFKEYEATCAIVLFNNKVGWLWVR